jgi:imidazolonepropionase-like amidohydrolase
MRTHWAMGGWMLAAVGGCAGPNSAPGPHPEHVLVGVTVIDGTGAAPMPDQTIEITNGRIAAIRPTEPGEEGTVKVAGSFVTPGLIDAHVHLPTDRLRAALDSMLSLGITSTRQMSASPDPSQYLSDADSSQFTRLYRSAAWAGLTYMRDDLRVRNAYAAAEADPLLLAVTDTTDLEAAIQAVRELGATGIKIFSDLDPPLVGAVAASARDAGLRVWSHAAVFPTKPSAVAESGVDVISHAGFLVWEGPPELPATYNGPHAWNPFGPPAPYSTVSHDDPAVVAVLETMRDRGVILDPTITVMRLLSEESRAWAVNLTRSAHEIGVRIAVGTDNLLLFDEIEALVQDVGLTPLEAIASGTSVGAAAIGVEGDFGSLEVGKVADLVVYSADPSVDITALRRPSHVFRGGLLVRSRQ